MSPSAHDPDRVCPPFGGPALGGTVLGIVAGALLAVVASLALPGLGSATAVACGLLVAAGTALVAAIVAGRRLLRGRGRAAAAQMLLPVASQTPRRVAPFWSTEPEIVRGEDGLARLAVFADVAAPVRIEPGASAAIATGLNVTGIGRGRPGLEPAAPGASPAGRLAPVAVDGFAAATPLVVRCRNDGDAAVEIAPGAPLARLVFGRVPRPGLEALAAWTDPALLGLGFAWLLAAAATHAALVAGTIGAPRDAWSALELVGWAYWVGAVRMIAALWLPQHGRLTRLQAWCATSIAFVQSRAILVALGVPALPWVGHAGTALMADGLVMLAISLGCRTWHPDEARGAVPG